MGKNKPTYQYCNNTTHLYNFSDNITKDSEQINHNNLNNRTIC